MVAPLTTVSKGRGLHLLLGRDDVLRTFAVGFLHKRNNNNSVNIITSIILMIKKINYCSKSEVNALHTFHFIKFIASQRRKAKCSLNKIHILYLQTHLIDDQARQAVKKSASIREITINMLYMSAFIQNIMGLIKTH